MKKHLKKFLLTLSLLLLTEATLMAMEGTSRIQSQTSQVQRLQRNWMNSLDFYYPSVGPVLESNGLISTDKWLLDTQRYINKENVEAILDTHEVKQAYENNICTGRFIIFYRSNLNNRINFVVWDLNKIFISGKLPIKENLRNHIISAMSFFPYPVPRNINVSKTQKESIDNLIGKNIVKSATCAEAAMVLHINSSLPTLINKIKEHEKGSGFEIIGTVLEISSLKDPCSTNCIPMCLGLMENMRNILINSAGTVEDITVTPILENLVLVAGRAPHLLSREGINENNEDIITLDFKNPQNRLFSKRND